jgi:hypothetical protein
MHDLRQLKTKQKGYFRHHDTARDRFDFVKGVNGWQETSMLSLKFDRLFVFWWFL